MGKILRGIFLVVIIFIVIAIIIAVLDNPMQKWEDFDNAELKSNIEKAFEEINLNSSGIERIAQIDDWANGPRYKITYNNDIYYVYAYDNNQLASINKDLKGEAIYTNENVDFENTDSNSIVLKYGELGKYGKTVTYDGQNYIKYFLPEGEYEVEALVRNAMFFIEDTEIYKNSSGHDESKTLDTIELSDVGSKQNITLKANNCINLVINSSISLKKIN
jgi:hypothetical protein